MTARFINVVRLLIVLASRHRSLVLENLALRQQLAVYRRTRPTPAIRWPDRLFWIGLRWGMAGLEIGLGGRPTRHGRRWHRRPLPNVYGPLFTPGSTRNHSEYRLSVNG